MKYYVRGKQFSYGEAVGILLIENYVPYIPGDVANATSYGFPVRFEPLNGFTPERLFAQDRSMYAEILAAAKRLVHAGVRAVTGDCGFLAIYQDRLAEELGVPVFLSSLMQLDFMQRILGSRGRVGIITANKGALTSEVLGAVTSVPGERLVIRGLEEKPHFVRAVFDEQGFLESDRVQEEVLEVADEIAAAQDVRAILLECSLLPPYAASVQERTGLPVFDYNTMITYVHSSVVARRYSGYM